MFFVTKERLLPGGPKAVDFVNLSLVAKAWGILLGLCGALVLTVSIWGLPVLGLGVLFFVTGMGLGRYRMWGWYLGVAVLVPLNVLGSIAAAAFLGFRIHSLGLLLAALSGIYVARVLLSKGGRERYRRIVEAKAKAESDPDSLAGRLYGRKGAGKRRGGKRGKPVASRSPAETEG